MVMSARRGCRRQNGFSLISTVFMLVILGLMAAVAVKAVDGTKSDQQGTGALLNEINQGAQGQANLSSGANGPRPPGGLAGQAATAACHTNVDGLQSSLATAQAGGAALPATIEEMVARRMVDAVPTVRGYTFSLEIVANSPTGKVLVNGLSGHQGCDA